MHCSSTWPWTVAFQTLCRGQGTVPPPLSRAEHLRAQTMDSSHNALLSPWSPSRAATQELALLISRMQANADQVERDILETQKRLQQVRTLHQGLGAQSQCLGGSPEGLLGRGTDNLPSPQPSAAHSSHREGSTFYVILATFGIK